MEDWLKQISPETVMLILGTIAGWLGWRKGKKTIEDVRHAIVDVIQKKWESVRHLSAPTNQFIREYFEKAVWDALTDLEVDKSKAVELVVHELVNDAVDRMATELLNARFQALFEKIGKIDVEEWFKLKTVAELAAKPIPE